MNKHEMLQEVSRTFALSIEQLPSALRDAVGVSYLLFRVSDCLEDTDQLPVERKARLLRLWAQILEGELSVEELTERISELDDSDPEVYVAQHAGKVLEYFHELPSGVQDIVSEYAAETSRGMARWQEHGPYMEDEEALDDYMHEVAGRVGYLVTDIFAWYIPAVRERREKLMPLAREFGLALQTVNVIRGLRKDYERGWVFVPQAFYEKVGLTRDELFDPDNVEQALEVVDMLAMKAERHLSKAAEYIRALPRLQHRIRLACMWPFFFAVKTLAISRNNVNVLLDEAKMTRDEVKRIILETKLFGWCNWWIEWYHRTLAEPRYDAEWIPESA